MHEKPEAEGPAILKYVPSPRSLLAVNVARDEQFGRERITALALTACAQFVSFVNAVALAGFALPSDVRRSLAVHLIAAFESATAPLLLELQKEREACDAAQRLSFQEVRDLQKLNAELQVSLAARAEQVKTGDAQYDALNARRDAAEATKEAHEKFLSEMLGTYRNLAGSMPTTEREVALGSIATRIGLHLDKHGARS